MSKIHRKWFPANMAEKERAQYEQTITASTTIARRLKEIIKADIAAIEAPKALDDYSPGWEYKQADRLGQLRSYRNMLKLLEFVNDQ